MIWQPNYQLCRIRVYNYPQRTNKSLLRRMETVMYSVALKFTKGDKSRIKHSLITGLDDVRGEYMELIAKRIVHVKKKDIKDIIVWLNYSAPTRELSPKESKRLSEKIERDIQREREKDYSRP